MTEHSKSSNLRSLTNPLFMECDTCRAKPGSPTLCHGCLVNRRVIENMTQERDDFKADYLRMHKAFMDAKYPETSGSETSADARDARRYRVLKSCIEPKTLYDKLTRYGMLRSNWQDLPPEQTIEQKIAELCDASREWDEVKPWACPKCGVSPDTTCPIDEALSLACGRLNGSPKAP